MAVNIWGRSKSDLLFEKVDYFKAELEKDVNLVIGGIYRVTPRMRTDSDMGGHYKNAKLTFLGYGGHDKDLLMFHDSIYNIQVNFHVMDFKGGVSESKNSFSSFYKLELLKLPNEFIKSNERA